MKRSARRTSKVRENYIQYYGDNILNLLQRENINFTETTGDIEGYDKIVLDILEELKR